MSMQTAKHVLAEWSFEIDTGTTGVPTAGTQTELTDFAEISGALSAFTPPQVERARINFANGGLFTQGINGAVNELTTEFTINIATKAIDAAQSADAIYRFRGLLKSNDGTIAGQVLHAVRGNIRWSQQGALSDGGLVEFSALMDVKRYIKSYGRRLTSPDRVIAPFDAGEALTYEIAADGSYTWDGAAAAPGASAGANAEGLAIYVDVARGILIRGGVDEFHTERNLLNGVASNMARASTDITL